MNETQKTIGFVVAGCFLVACALATSYMSQPSAIDQFEFVGEEFYPEFESAEKAKFLEVSAYNEKTSEAKSFRVEFKDGLWRIPSHHDYPAEAKDRLAKTATSIIGIKREALAGRRENEHERFGVVDPANENAKDEESTGTRIKLGLFKEGEEVALADFIIGKQVEENDIGDAELRRIRGE